MSRQLTSGGAASEVPETQAERLPPGAIGRAAMVAGLLVGGTHVAFLELRREMTGRLTEMSRDFLWAGPASYAMWFLAAALPLLLLRRTTRPVVYGWLAAWSCLSLLLLLPALHPWSSVACAIGVGMSVARRPPEVWPRWERVLRRGALVVVLGGAFAGVGQRALPWWRERRTGPASDPAAANVLLLIWDTVGASSVSAWGYGRRTTPELERIMPEGTRFLSAMSPAAWTLPSHASMMTGEWAAATGSSYLSPVDPDLPTLSDVLRGRGYLTTAFIANAGWAGLETGVSRGFARYETHPFEWQQFLLAPTLVNTRVGRRMLRALSEPSWRGILSALRSFDLHPSGAGTARLLRAHEVGSRFLAWRRTVPEGAPYFAMLNMIDAHFPYEPPGAWRTRFSSAARSRDRYDGAIAYQDSVTGALIDSLRARGELDRTIVIVTSDHGELFGLHGLDGHGNSVYLPVVHVPLYVRYPRRVPAGAPRQEVVSLRDLPATVLDLLGSPNSFLPGRSWFADSGVRSPVLVHASAGVRQPEKYRTARGPVDGVLDERWHLIRNPDGTVELFEWRKDPREERDLAGDPGVRPVIAALSAFQDSVLGRRRPR